MVSTNIFFGHNSEFLKPHRGNIKMGGSKIDNTKKAVFGNHSELLKPESFCAVGNLNSKACRFYWYKPFGCAPPKALLYEATFSHKFKS